MNAEKLLETIGEIDEELIAGAKVRKKRLGWAKWAAAAACVGLLAAGFAVPKLLMPARHIGGNDNTVRSDNPSVESSEQEPPTTETTQSAVQIDLMVNECSIAELAMDMDVQQENYGDKPAQAVQDAFYDAVGVKLNDFIACIPAELRTQWRLSSLSTRAGEDAAYRIHDYVLHCTAEHDGQVEIAVSALARPLRDWLLSCEEPVQSYVSGTSVEVYGAGELYIAMFEYKGACYDMTTHNLSLTELESLLAGLLT